MLSKDRLIYAFIIIRTGDLIMNVFTDLKELYDNANADDGDTVGKNNRNGNKIPRSMLMAKKCCWIKPITELYISFLMISHFCPFFVLFRMSVCFVCSRTSSEPTVFHFDSILYKCFEVFQENMQCKQFNRCGLLADICNFLIRSFDRLFLLFQISQSCFHLHRRTHNGSCGFVRFMCVFFSGSGLCCCIQQRYKFQTC